MGDLNNKYLFFTVLEVGKCKIKVKQARIRESLGLIEKYCISDWPCSGSGTTLTWPGKHPCPSPLIDDWMGITWFWFCPSHRLAKLLKAPGEEKHTLPADSNCAHDAPFCIPFPHF
jgi:hypothetical protein